MATLNYLKSPNGWKNWTLLRTTINNVYLPDSPLPSTYLPASGFWLQSIMDHCAIPWINTYDPMTLYLIGGGVSGSSIGALSGLAVIGLLFDIMFKNATFGIGYESPPSTGYCIGKEFKQQAYIRMDVQNNAGETLLNNINVQLVQNYKFKRIYVHHGEILSAKKVEGFDNRFELDIGITKEEPCYNNEINDIIYICPVGTSVFIKGNVIQIKQNWNIVIEINGQIDSLISGFYKLNNPWCIENPYLLSGFWQGTENEFNSQMGITESSGLDLYRTLDVKPYLRSKILGVYIWQVFNASQSLDLSSVFTPPPIYNSSMQNSDTSEWAFYGFGNEFYSPIYQDDIRYNTIFLDVNDEEGSLVKYQDRQKATLSQYNELLRRVNNKDPSITYWRLDINGGYVDKHNFYSPCLIDSYLVNDGHYFKILGQPEAGIIDVSVVSVDGEILDPYKNQDFEIINQYGWFIIEHYDSNSQSNADKGFARGTITSMSGNFISIDCDGDSSVSWVKYNDINFQERYFTQPLLPNALSKRYSDFDGYRIAKVNGDSYSIDSVVRLVKPSVPNEPYKISVILNNSTSDLKSGDNVYLTFGKPFDTLFGFSRESGYSFVLENFGLGLSTTEKSVEMQLFGGLIKGDALCISGTYFSNPYKIDLSLSTRIGITNGYLFGIDINGSAKSRIGNYIYITTPRFDRGLASLFHALRMEDWILYYDYSTSKLTIRRGCLDYHEYPQKSEVVIGYPIETKKTNYSSESGEIKLDNQYARLQRLILYGIDEYTKGTSPVITFGIGSKNFTYGFAVSGDGLVDLQMLRLQGVGRGQVNSDFYRDSDNQSISPVYVYKESVESAVGNLYVDMAAETDDTIYINNASAVNITAQYVNEEQTIRQDGLFDIIRLNDGELLILYSQEVAEFTTNSGINNSSSIGTAWSKKTAVFAIGSNNDAHLWGPPSAVKENLDLLQNHPVMLLNAVEYVGCIHDPISDKISIFVRAYFENYAYIGCLSINPKSLIHDVVMCNSNSGFNFYYRPPLLTKDFILDKNKSWINNDNDYIKTLFEYNPKESSYSKDQYLRVVGTVNGSQVRQSGNLGIISTNLLADNSYMLLYDTDTGLRGCFSNDQGVTWCNSNLIYARDGKGGCIVDRYLFYITDFGIKVKKFDYFDFSAARTIAIENIEGNSSNLREENIQNDFDQKSSILIGSGKIEYQRLSGYITNDNIIKVFFYDNNGRLKGMESNDGSVWTVCDNF